MEGTVTIRWLEQRDIPSVLSIQARSPEASQWKSEDYERACSGGMLAWVAPARQSVCGFLIACRIVDELEILNFAVLPECRRQGIGSALLKHALEWKKSKNVAGVFLEVRASNETGIQFYTSHGFEITGKRRNYYSCPTEDALLLTRPERAENAQ